MRQSYLQKLLKQALIAVGHPEGAERSHHFSYEMVALSHATARELGFAPPPDSEDARRPFVEVSGRKGPRRQGRRPARSLDRKSGRGGGKTQSGIERGRPQRIARMIGIAAVRYFMIKFSRGKVIAFDLDEALSFEGESGPYIQYAVVRANKIFEKLEQREGIDDAALLDIAEGRPCRRARRRQRVPRGLVSRARRRAARRSRRADHQVARILGFGEVCVFAGAGVQRVLPSRTDPERRAGRRAAMARGGRDLRPEPVDARPGPDGGRGATEDVMPIIAISPSSKLHDYEEAVRREGGEVRVLDWAKDRPAEVVRSIDGLLLSGGGDVLPSIYGAAAHSSFSAAEEGRDETNRAGAPRDRGGSSGVCDLPGIQVLNVALGGTLVQDIPDEVSRSIDHMVREPRVAIAHDVWMAPDSPARTPDARAD